MRLLYTGVYQIRNIITNKVYIGSAARRFSSRKSRHFNDLRNNKHYNKHLQSAWNLYGEHNFLFEIIERCSPELCIEREQYWIDQTKSASNEFGYNILPTAGSNKGCKLSEEHKANISKNSARRKWTSEERKASSKAHLGKKATYEVPVYQYDNKGNFIAEWRNACLAAETLTGRKGKGVGSPITSVCKGRHKHSYNFYWSYTKLDRGPVFEREKSVVQYSLDGTIIKEWESTRLIVATLFPNNTNAFKSITRAAAGERLTCYGFKWLYKTT